MCRTYDSAYCVVELASKEQVRCAVQGGWRCVASACFPTPAAQTSLLGSQNPHIIPILPYLLRNKRLHDQEKLPIDVIHESLGSYTDARTADTTYLVPHMVALKSHVPRRHLRIFFLQTVEHSTRSTLTVALYVSHIRR